MRHLRFRLWKPLVCICCLRFHDSSLKSSMYHDSLSRLKFTYGYYTLTMCTRQIVTQRLLLCLPNLTTSFSYGFYLLGIATNILKSMCYRPYVHFKNIFRPFLCHSLLWLSVSTLLYYLFKTSTNHHYQRIVTLLHMNYEDLTCEFPVT